MEKIAKESYPQVELLKQVKGVGTQIALTYILTPGRSASVPEESRGRLFSGVVPRAQGLRGEPANVRIFVLRLGMRL
jgi:hypothetical protein